MPSVQLATYLQLRGHGVDVEAASIQAEIPITEARLTETAVERGELTFTQGEETDMARADKDQTKVEQVHAPDFAKMKRIFENDLKPVYEKSSKARGDLSAAWGAIEKDCHCNRRAAKLLFRLRNESEETRDDFLRTLYGGMKALGIGISQDLVDKMNDEDAPTMPVVDSQGLGQDNLATIGGSRPDPDAAFFDNDSQATLPAA